MTIDIKALLKKYEEANKELNTALRENGEQFIEALFTDIFERHPGVNKLAVLGWTPSFNDGDICSHSSEFFSGVIGNYNGRQYTDADDYGDVSDWFENVEEDELLDGTVRLLQKNTTDDNKVLSSAKSALKAFEEIFERVYYTNFLVKAARLSDGSVIVEHEEYNPGY